LRGGVDYRWVTLGSQLRTSLDRAPGISHSMHHRCAGRNDFVSRSVDRERRPSFYDVFVGAQHRFVALARDETNAELACRPMSRALGDALYSLVRP